MRPLCRTIHTSKVSKRHQKSIGLLPAVGLRLTFGTHALLTSVAVSRAYGSAEFFLPLPVESFEALGWLVDVVLLLGRFMSGPSYSARTDTDVLIVGAGPVGLF